MAEFEIYTDSSANLPEELRREHNIHVISYVMHVGGQDIYCYEEGTDFHQIAKIFYEKMRAGLEAKTSLIGEQRFIDAVSPALEAGKDALIVTIASGISGTWNQAVNATAELEEKFPGRKVYVCDSANASMGQGLIVLRAAKLREEGKTAEETATWLWENTYKLNSYVTVDDLKFLRRSGRISAATAIAGNLLNIKPLIKADGKEHPQLMVYGKTHGRKKSIAALIEAFDANVEDAGGQTIAIAHADCEEDAASLAETLKASHGVKDVIIEYYDLCTGSHIGPGTIALFFWGKDRRTEAEKKSFLQRAKEVFLRDRDKGKEKGKEKNKEKA